MATIVPKENPLIETVADGCCSWDHKVVEEVFKRLANSVIGKYWIGPFHYRVVGTTVNFYGTEQHPRATMTMTIEYWSRSK